MISITPWKQSDLSLCGPAVVKMVLGYYGIDVSEADAAKRCGHSFERGCTNSDIKKALKSYGVSSSIYTESSLDALEYWNRLAIPVIVDWFTPGVGPGPGDMPNGHSSIVVDIDSEKVYLLDPEDGKIRPILRDEFVRVWFDWIGDPTISKENLLIRLAIVPKAPDYRGKRY